MTVNDQRATDYDVIVVGGGPTGAALAGDLGQRRRQVLLVEKTDGIVHDVTGHGSPGTLSAAGA